jgi:hypothetical protein
MAKNSRLHAGVLSIKEIERLVTDTRAGILTPRLHNDGSVPGLYIDLRKGAAWLFRFTSPSKRNAAGKPQVRDMGIGSLYLPSVGLKTGLGPADARGKARAAR